MLSRRTTLKCLSMAAASSALRIEEATAATRTVYTDSNFRGMGRGTLDAPYTHPSQWWPNPYTMEADFDAYLFKSGSDFLLDSYLRTAPGRSTRLLVGSYGGSERPVFRAAVPCQATDCARVDFDMVVPPGAGEGRPPTVSPSSTSSLWQLQRATTDGGSSYFAFWGAFGDGIFGVQTDVQNITRRDSAGQRPTAARQWCHAQGGWVIHSPANPVAAFGTLYKLNYTQRDAKASEGFLFKISLPGSEVTVSDIDWRDARGAILYAAGDLPDTVVPPFTVRSCAGSGLFNGLQFSGGRPTKDGRVYFDRCLVDRNTWSNLGDSWFSTNGSGYIGFKGSVVSNNVHDRCCQAYSTGGIYTGKMYGLADPVWDEGTRQWLSGGLHIHHNTGSRTGTGHFWRYDGYDFYNEWSADRILWEQNLSWNSARPFIMNGAEALSVMHRCIAINTAGHRAGAAFTFTNDKKLRRLQQRVTWSVARGYTNFGKSNEDTSDSDLRWENNLSLGDDTPYIGDGIRSSNANTIPGQAPPGTRLSGNWFHGHANSYSEHWRDAWNVDPTTHRNPGLTRLLSSYRSDDNTAVVDQLPKPTAHGVGYANQVRAEFWHLMGL